MLVAQNHKNNLIILNSHISRDDLRELKKSNRFYCPQCKETVILKIGKVKIPHFAHQSNHECNHTFSENESMNHILGKEQLYIFFKKEKNLDTQLEPYLKEVHQRPDLLVKKNNQNYAIEFQCSPIEDELFKMRNNGYFSIGIKPIWIPYIPQNTKIQNPITKISFPIWLRKFMLRNKAQSFFITYNPHSQQFIYFSNLLHVYGNKFLTKIILLPISKQHFPFFIPKQIAENEFTTYIKAYNKMKRNYLKTRILTSRKGVNDLFLRSIYELRLTLNNLPLFLGVPVKGNEQLNQFSIEWQTALFYYMYLFKKSSNEMKGQAIQHFFSWSNICHSKGAIKVVEAYCEMLERLKISDISSKVSEERLNREIYRQFLAFNPLS